MVVLSSVGLYYAAQEGIKLRGSNNDSDSRRFLVGLMDRLEKMKKPLAERFSELTSGGDEYVRAFALRVFNKADDDDRAGRACKYAHAQSPARTLARTHLHTLAHTHSLRLG
eukprot:TRINITY_DN1855_c0_g1_i1.p3 TRINITY_DN1855_c0_g1~~TRINITY_DN1855_c0_g1_i1.p3  ORF type:complete len:112 (-),score=10.70 TRINITY_DN1855_c0_g1_i1:526-861(-)